MTGRRFATPVLVVGAVSIVAMSAGLPSGVGGAQTALAAGTHVLTQQVVTVPVGANSTPAATLVGALASSTPMTIDVAIDSNLAAKQAAVNSIYDPSSPTYHQYFTNASWAAQFSVPQATFDSVVSPLTALGMHELYSDDTRDLVELSATVAQVDAAFNVTEQQWQLTGSGRVYYANDVAPTVAADVDAVQGLTDVGFVEKGKVTDQGCPSVTPPCTGSLEGTEIRQIYGVGTTFTGTGQALAVNGDGDTQGPAADLQKYESDRSLPAVQTVFVNTDSDTCVASGVQASACDTSGEGEWALDATSSTAMAPGVAKLYWFFPSALGNASGFQAWADYGSHPGDQTPVPMQENASWGECEAYGSTFVPVADGSMVTYTSAFIDADGKGKTQFVSAGDLGAGCVLTGVNGVTPGGPPQVQWPCSSQWVVCVGGTVLYSNGQTGSSEARADLGGTCTPVTGVNQLNDCAELGWSHTGGGTSYIISAPSWQQSLPLVGHCVVDPSGTPYPPPPPLCRGVPDVAALSGDITVLAGNDGNGFDDVEGGTPQTGSGGPTAGSETVDGGTSLSDPLWEGLWADIQSDPAPGGTWGFAAPLLYQIGENPSEDSCAFYDVQADQAGSNFPYPAVPRDTADPTGWDYVSGLGVPNVGCLESELIQNQAVVPEAPSAVLLLAIPGALGLTALVRRRTRRAGRREARVG